MSILFVNASPNPRGTTARLAAQLLAGKSYDTIELGCGTGAWRATPLRPGRSPAAYRP